MSMVASYFVENPLLVAIGGTIVVAVFVLLVGALISRLFGRRRAASDRREPAMHEDASVGWSGVEPVVAEPVAWPPEPVETPRRQRRSSFGYAALTIAFLLGFVAGGVGLAVSSRSVASAVASLLERVGPMIRADAGAVTSTGIDGGEELVEPARNTQPAASLPVQKSLSPEVVKKLTAYAEGLKSLLPRPAGGDLTLTRVDVYEDRLSLGYIVGRVMLPEDTPAFEAFVTKVAKSLFCGRESAMRNLSDAGVIFDMDYVDAAGETVTKLTIEPGFCG